MEKTVYSLDECLQMIPRLRDEVRQLKQIVMVQLKEIADESEAEKLLNVREAALLTNFSEQTIRTKVMQGIIPSLKVDGKRLFRKNELLQWINRTAHE